MKKENYKKVVELVIKHQNLKHHLKMLENPIITADDYVKSNIRAYFNDLCQGITSLSVDEINTIKEIIIKRLQSDIKDIEFEINEL
jgi:hypothetical protein